VDSSSPGRRDKPKTKRRNKTAVAGADVAAAGAVAGVATRAARRMVAGMRETSLRLERQEQVVVVEDDDPCGNPSRRRPSGGG
jgi:hypothetical protein